MENQTKETNSIITRQEEINQSVQGSFCSFVAETDEQKASLYKAMTSPDRKMSDFINQKINAVDVFVEQVEITDDETGEVAVLPRVVIFDQDGTTWHFQCLEAALPGVRYAALGKAHSPDYQADHSQESQVHDAGHWQVKTKKPGVDHSAPGII